MSDKGMHRDKMKIILSWIVVGILIRLLFIWYSFGTKSPLQAGRDGSNYITIARHGYTSWSIVFPPLYPLMLKLLSFPFGYIFAAFFISLLSASLAHYFFVRIIQLDDIIPEPHRVHLSSLVFIFGNFGWLHMSSMPSTEAPAMAFLLASIYFFKVEKYLPASLLLFAGSLTRTTILLFFPYFAYLIYRNSDNIWKTIYAIPAGFGYIIHSIIGYIPFDDIFIISKTQKEWGTYLVFPLHPLRHLYYLGNELMAYPQLLSLIICIIGLYYYRDSEYFLQGIILVIFLLSLSHYAFWAYGFARQSIYVLAYYFFILKMLHYTISDKSHWWLFVLLVTSMIVVNSILTISYIDWMGNR